MAATNKVMNVYVSALALNCLHVRSYIINIRVSIVLQCLCGAVYCYLLVPFTEINACAFVVQESTKMQDFIKCST